MASFTVDIIVSTFFFILTMYGSIMGGSGKVKISGNTDLQAALGVTQRGGEEEKVKPQNVPIVEKDKEEVGDANLAKYTSSYNWVKWHFYMCLASLYVGMLITNWTSESLTTG